MMASAPLTIKLFVMSFLLAGQPGRHGDRGVVIAQPSKEQTNVTIQVKWFMLVLDPVPLSKISSATDLQHSWLFFSIHGFIDFFFLRAVHIYLIIEKSKKNRYKRRPWSKFIYNL
jgi:hypothetical protein